MQRCKWSLARLSPPWVVPVQADRPESSPIPPLPSCPPASHPLSCASPLPFPRLLATGSVPPLPPFYFTPPSALCAALSVPPGRVRRDRRQRCMTWAVHLARPLLAVSWGGTEGEWERGRRQDGARARREGAGTGEVYYPLAAHHRRCLCRHCRHRLRLCFRCRCLHRRREPTPRLCGERLPVWGRLRTCDAAMILTPTSSLACLMGPAGPLSLSLLLFTPLPVPRPPHPTLLTPSLSPPPPLLTPPHLILHTTLSPTSARTPLSLPPFPIPLSRASSTCHRCRLPLADLWVVGHCRPAKGD